MSRSILLWQASLMAPLTVLAGWAVNNLPAADKINLPILPWQLLLAALGASVGLALLPALFQAPSPEPNTQASNFAWGIYLVPLLASGGLFFLVQQGRVPTAMEVPYLYASLGLFVLAAVLPSALVVLQPLLLKSSTFTLSDEEQVFESPAAEWQVRQEFLEVVQAEVQDRLKSAFHNRVRLKLDKDKHPAEVKRSWDLEIKLLKTDPVPLPRGTSIVSVFDQAEVGGRLLILGKPGAGKTTTLLELADALVARAQESHEAAIPVILSLSDWNEHVPFPEWIVTRLKRKYGLRDVISRRWIKQAKFLLLLDGLDEVTPELQNSCIQTLNQFQQGYPLKRLVVCSRLEEYQQLTEQLQLNSAISLKPLRHEQVREYLLRRASSELWQGIQDDAELMDLATTPFFLDVIALLDQKRLKPAERSASRHELRTWLLNAYIKQRFQSNPDVPKQTLRWLSWLAKIMQEQSRDEFFIEELQPKELLSDSQLRIYQLLGILFFSLPSGVGLGLLFGQASGASVGLAWGVLCGLTTGLLFGLESDFWEVSLVEATNWSWSNIFAGLTSGLTSRIMKGWLLSLCIFVPVVLITGLRLILMGLSSQLQVMLLTLLTVWLTIGLSFWLFSGLIGGLRVAEVRVRTFPNQGILSSGLNALIYGLIGGFSMGLISGVLGGVLGEIAAIPTDGTSVGIAAGVCGGVFGGIGAGLIFGGKACIKHFLLRFLLWYWKYSPRNYAQFLNYATDELLFLQRVGGGYRFVHGVLRSRFAEH